MQALEVLEEETCPGCGGYLPETTDAANEGTRTPGKYVVHDPGRCHRCTALSIKADTYASNRDVAAPHALRYAVELVTRPTKPTTT